MKSPVSEPVSSRYSSLSNVSVNIRYIEKALPTIAIADAERSQIVDLCDEFHSALYDVRKEVCNLEDKLGMHIGEEPFDPDIVNPDPMEPGMSADSLRGAYSCYGEVPSIFNKEGLVFEPYKYVYKRIRELTGDRAWRLEE